MWVQYTNFLIEMKIVIYKFQSKREMNKRSCSHTKMIERLCRDQVHYRDSSRLYNQLDLLLLITISTANYSFSVNHVPFLSPENMFTSLLTISIILSSSAADASDGCPPSFISFSNQCYLFSNYTLDFNDFDHFCRFHHSIPVSVHSASENEFLKNQLQNWCPNDTNAKLTSTRAWLGSYDCEWEWRDETPFDYHNFSSFAPHDHGVITLDTRGVWTVVKPSIDKFWPSYLGGHGRSHEAVKMIAICKKQSPLSDLASISNQFTVDGKTITIIVLSVCMVGTLILLLTNNNKKGEGKERLVDCN